jgi:putative transposase
MERQPLIPGKYFHIYNRGNNGIDVFLDNDSYFHFLKLYAQYIEPVAETYVWCLLKNHFHVLVYLKEDFEIDTNQLEYSTVEKAKIITASNQFSHLFNAYTQAINKRHHRTGSLFEKPFERKLVTSERYLQNLIYYIHNNPVHHGFTDNINDYPWSSYESILSTKATKLKRKEIIDMFNGTDNFIDYHNKEQNLSEIFDFMIE